MRETKYKCPTCNGHMWMDYDSWMGGKDYFYKCSKKKHHNPNCLDKNKYWECNKCEKPSFACICLKNETQHSKDCPSLLGKPVCTCKNLKRYS